MTADGVRCEVSDLPPDWCGHCIGEQAKGRARAHGRHVLTADDVLQVSTRPALLPTGVDRRPRIEFRVPTPADVPSFAAPAGAESPSRQFGPIFAAAYAGQCAGCGDRVDEGDSIRHSDPHGGFIHEGCEEE